MKIRDRPVHTGDYSPRFRRLFVAENSDSHRKRRLRQSPFSVTVAEIGDYSLQCGQAMIRPIGSSLSIFSEITTSS